VMWAGVRQFGSEAQVRGRGLEWMTNGGRNSMKLATCSRNQPDFLDRLAFASPGRKHRDRVRCASRNTPSRLPTPNEQGARATVLVERDGGGECVPVTSCCIARVGLLDVFRPHTIARSPMQVEKMVVAPTVGLHCGCFVRVVPIWWPIPATATPYHAMLAMPSSCREHA
jgi:hypothetical protein